MFGLCKILNILNLELPRPQNRLKKKLLSKLICSWGVGVWFSKFQNVGVFAKLVLNYGSQITTATSDLFELLTTVFRIFF